MLKGLHRRSSMPRHFPIILFLVLLAGCSSEPEKAPVIGEGYVGALTLPVREELTARAKTVATAKYGERLDIIGKRRRFLRVRTESGKEGWVDSTQLFDRDDIENLRALAERAAKAPSQGEATVFDVLNVHSAPNRQAPSFFQIQPEEKADVIIHQRAPRTAFVPPELVSRPIEAPKIVRKKKEPSVPPPPRGPAPRPPRDWLELSGHPELSGLEPDEAVAKLRETRVPAPGAPQFEDWTLVRSREGRAGWVLTRMLFMAIPDEVAQYAERARISAYFPVGTIKTKDGATFHEWFWATLARPGQGVHFDCIRLFTYNTRRNRYETAFIDRKAEGWLPITIHRDSGGRVAGLSFVGRESSGAVVQRDYSLTGGRLRLSGKHPARQPEDWYMISEKGGRGKQNLPATAEPSLAERATKLIETLRRKVAPK